MKHKVFRCIETKGQIWERCTALKGPCTCSGHKNIGKGTKDTWVESSCQIKSTRNKLSKSAFTQFQSFWSIICRRSWKVLELSQNCQACHWHHQLALTMLLQDPGSDYNDVRHSKAKVWYIDLMNQLQGKLKTNLFPVAKNFFPLFFSTGSNFDICQTQITCFF